MITIQIKKWIPAILILVPTAYLQYPIYQYPVMVYQQQIPVPVPYPAPVPYLLPVPISSRQASTTTTTTSTTTTERPIPIAVPIPVAVPAVQFGVPALKPPTFCVNKARPPNCPPCPPCLCFPSCTPSFFSFCSPCHQKCRCKNANDAPTPIPPQPPRPIPGPAYPMPVPLPAYPFNPGGYAVPNMAQPPVVLMPFPTPRFG